LREQGAGTPTALTHRVARRRPVLLQQPLAAAGSPAAIDVKLIQIRTAEIVIVKVRVVVEPFAAKMAIRGMSHSEVARIQIVRTQGKVRSMQGRGVCSALPLNTNSAIRAWIRASLLEEESTGRQRYGTGQAISATQPGPVFSVSRKPCNLTMAETRLRPSPAPRVLRLLSDL
jgi:hypothetical protein